MRKSGAESGFTLLELLISLAMVAVVLTACLMAVRLATASREAGTQKTDVHQRLRVLHERLNSTLRSAHLIFVPADSGSLLPDEDEEKSSNSKVLAFEGKEKSIRFVTFNEKLIESKSLHWMHEVYFHVQKNEETDLLEILLTERDFSPETFFKQGPQEPQTGQTLRIAQDVAYLKFRYYYEISEKGNSSTPTEEKPVKVSGEWVDKFITEPFDFKSNTIDDKNIEEPGDSARLPRAVEVSVGLWERGLSGETLEPKIVDLPPTLIPIQSGMVFERPEEEKENSSVPEE